MDPLLVELFVSGCPTCEGAEDVVQKALAPFGARVALQVFNVGDDADVPTEYGVLATPAVVVGRKVAVESVTADRVARAVERALGGA